MCLEAFQSHPLDGQLDSTLVVDAVVFFIINVSGQAEVRHLHSVALIQPVEPKTRRFDFSTSQVCRKLLFWLSSILPLLSIDFSHSHAVPGSKVSMDKLLAGQILHPSGYLQPEAHQVLHRWVL